MLILIPLGGLGTRFSKNNYKLPKPLINVMGKPIIYWLLDNLNIKQDDIIIIPYNNELSDRPEIRITSLEPLGIVFIITCLSTFKSKAILIAKQRFSNKPFE